MRLGRFVVRGGSITYDNQRSGQHETIDGIDMDFAWPSVGAPAAGSGRFTWRGETVDFNASVGAPLALMTGSISPLRFAIASMPVRFSFNGTGLNLNSMQLNGETTITTPSVRRLMTWLGKPIGAGSTFGAAAITGKLTWVRPVAAFDNAKIELDGNQAEGAVTASFGTKPDVQGTLAFDKLDLSAYVEAFDASLSANGPWRSVPAAMRLTASDLDLRLSAAEVIAGSARIGRTAAAINVDDGKLTLTVGEAQFYGGRAEARLSAAMDGDVLQMSGEAKLDDVATRAALVGLLGLDALDGKGAVSIDLAAKGKTWGEIAAGASGTASVTIADGRLSGIDVAQLAEIARNPGVTERAFRLDRLQSVRRYADDGRWGGEQRRPPRRRRRLRRDPRRQGLTHGRRGAGPRYPDHRESRQPRPTGENVTIRPRNGTLQEISSSCPTSGGSRSGTPQS